MKVLIGNNRIVMLLEPFSYTLSSREAEGRRAEGGGGGGEVSTASPPDVYTTGL